MKRILSSILLLALAAAAHGQTLTFTLETSSNDGKSVVPRLTWSTSPTAGSCTASGASDWTGTKAASGTTLLAAVITSRTYSLVCSWPGVERATLRWTLPTTNTDGTPYTDASQLEVVYGTSATALTQSALIANPATTTWTSPTLAPGTWHFAVRAVNARGLKSENSNVMAKVITAGASQSRALELTIRFPNPPVLEE